MRRTTAVAKSSDPSLATFFAPENAEASRNSTEQQKQIEALLETPEEKALFATLSQARQRYIAARDAVNKAKADGQAEEAEKRFNSDFRPAGVAYLDSLQALLDQQRASINTAAANVQSGYTRGRVLMISLGALALLTATALAYLITRGVAAMRPGQTSLRRLAIVPALFTWGLPAMEGCAVRVPAPTGSSRDDV